MKSEQSSFETEFLVDHITSELWRTLQSTQVVPTEEHLKHKEYIVQKLKTFMENDKEKWCTTEGEVFYKRIDDFVSLLE